MTAVDSQANIWVDDGTAARIGTWRRILGETAIAIVPFSETIRCAGLPDGVNGVYAAGQDRRPYVIQ